MHKIQGINGVSFAGAYLRYGFHEDGFTSGLVAAVKAAEMGGGSIKPPFEIEFAKKELEWTTLKAVIAGVFELLEGAGIRTVVGWVGSLALTTLGIILLQF
jgi:hypothetical protein